MKKLLFSILLVLALTALWGCGTGSPPYSPSMPASSQSDPASSGEVSPEELPPEELPLLQCLYYDQQLVEGGIRVPRPYQVEGRLAAGLVPHHLLASDMIAGFFELASRQEAPASRVLILSTSHFPENYSQQVITARVQWDTPYGLAELDRETVDALLDDPLLSAADVPDAVEADHGVAGIIPFVKKYLPEARVSVCLVSNRLSAKRLEALQGLAAELAEEGDLLLVASVDCSHYLTPQEAVPMDEETAQAIESWDFGRIMTFGDDHVDSPQAVTTFLAVARSAGAELVRLDHSSSPEKLPYALSNPVYGEGITTYYVYAAMTAENAGS